MVAALSMDNYRDGLSVQYMERASSSSGIDRRMNRYSLFSSIPQYDYDFAEVYLDRDESPRRNRFM